MKITESHGKLHIKNYCKHGDLEIWKKKAGIIFNIYQDKISTDHYLLCDKCKEEYFLLEKVNEEDIKESRILLNIIKNKKKSIETYYPKVYLCIISNSKVDNFYEQLYLFKNNLTVKLCKNCGKINHRYDNKFCSQKCSIENLKRNGHFSKIRKDYHEKHVIEDNKQKFPLFNFIIEKKGVIKNYCRHGDIKMKDYKLFKKLYLMYGKEINNSEYICNDCKEEIKILKAPKKEETLYFLSNKRLRSEIYIKKFFPHIWVIINQKIGKSWVEKKFIFENSISTPICSYENCNNLATFNKSNLKFNLTCNQHINSAGISYSEIEIGDFLTELNINFHRNDRKQIIKELDIYINEKKIAIEYNGLYWHNDEHLQKNYHYNKWKLCNEKGIKLITIWEDDWNFKQDLVKSMIKNQLGLNENKIYARKTIIKEVSAKESKEFLENNHIQGNCQSSIRLGLFYKGELVSLMTFGKRRMVLKAISSKNQYELLRFCNKQNTIVVGGASKLFKYFVDNYNPFEIVSYANLDISNGTLYYTLGFINKGHTGVNYWWVKDKRYHRSNFMKHKLIAEGANPNLTENEIMREKGYKKIYGTGNLRFIWNPPKTAL
jgi:hypothetical protein